MVEQAIMATCEVCKREKWEDRYSAGCSEFCAVEPEEVIASYLAMKPGDYGVWPCSECGCPTEGDWSGPDDYCSGCAPKVKLRKCRILLLEALPHVPEPLAQQIRDAVKN